MRAVVLTDIAAVTPYALVQATLASAKNRPDFEVSGFATSNPAELLPPRFARLKKRLKRLTVAALSGRATTGQPTDVSALARRHDEGTKPIGFTNRETGQ